MITATVLAIIGVSIVSVLGAIGSCFGVS